MSSISKYANLPGIALDQPDVYETQELPEADQMSVRLSQASASFDADQSDNVSVINVKPEQAFKVFKEKTVDSRHVDFSGTLTDKPSVGYQSFGEWEILDPPSRDQETPLQKYHRIQAETAELIDKLKQPRPAASNEHAGFSGGLTPSDLIASLDQLNSQLRNLNVQDLTDVNIFGDIQQSPRVYSQLCSQLEEIKNVHTVKETKVASTPDSVVTYQLMCYPELDRTRQLGRLNMLEQRLKRLEHLFGNDESKISFLTSLTNEKSLLEAVNVLSTRVSLLDSSQLEALDSRLKTVLHKLNQASEKKAQIEDIEKQTKVDQLYEIVMKNEKHSASLPSILSRLTALSDIQEQAVQFSSALSYIDTLQSQLEETMKTNEYELATLKETFINTVDDVKKIVENLNKRIESLN